METSLLLELEEILKVKPETPKCPDDKSHGKCLIWTNNEGWTTTFSRVKEE